MAPEGVIGRTDELAVIGDVIGAFPDGPRALVLAGEAGIGKTVLWEEAEREARARGDLTVLTSRSSETEVGLAYVALTDLLAPIASPVLPTLPQPQAVALASALLLDAHGLDEGGPTTPVMADPRTVGTAVLGLLRAAAVERPVLLAIDDVQWIDPASAAALEFALRRATDLPIGLLVTVRTPTAAGSGARILTALGGRTRTLDVGPISLGVLHHLVRDRAGASLTRPQLVRLEAASRGNPLLAIEMARELARLDRWPIIGEPLPVPADMAGLLGDRLGRLSELERDALFVAAAIASPTIESVATAFGTGQDRIAIRAAIDRAIDDGLLTRVTDDALRFGHPLMAEAALHALTPVRARRMHARLADLATTVEDRGRHVALAADGPDSEAADRVDAAAWSARTRGATAVAAGWAEVAARLTPDAEPERRATRLSTAGRWFADAGEIERGRALLERSVAELAPGDPRASARLALAQLSGWDGGPAAVVRGCEEALAEARDPDLRARIRLRLAGEPDVLGFTSAIGHAMAAVDELEAMADPDPDLMACALLQSAQTRFEAGVDDDAAAVARGASLLDVDPRRSSGGEVRAESLRAHALRWQWAADHDDLAGALAGALVEIRRTRDRLGMDRPVPILEADIAYLMAWAGDLAGARDHARAARDASDLLGTREGRSAALGAIGVVALHAGDLRGAEDAARAGLAMAAEPPDWLDARHEATLGAAALVRADATTATTMLGGLFDRLMRVGARQPSNLRFAGDLIEAAVATGDLPRAREVIELLEDSIHRAPRPWVTTVLARGRALVQAAEGDMDAADAAIRAALEAAAGLPMPVERARTELVAGRIARRRKEKRRAGEHLDRAVEGFRSIGATAWLAIAESDLARLGRQRRGGDDLTETEDRVARLAAAGMTNREVGEAAFLTAKSVEGVLARVYGKLGIRSRAELGAWLAGQEADVGAARVPGRED